MIRSIIDHAFPLYRLMNNLRAEKSVHRELDTLATFCTDSGLLSLLNRDGAIPFEISNAAGMNPNGQIPGVFLRTLGFNRNVVGTVTGEYHEGNPFASGRRRVGADIIHYKGIPNQGANQVRKNLESGNNLCLPITLSVAPTPGKDGIEAIDDIIYTVETLHEIVDRIELNTDSIPVPSYTSYTKERFEYLDRVHDLIMAANDVAQHPLYVKVSADLPADGVSDMVKLAKESGVIGLVGVGGTVLHGYDETYDLPSIANATGELLKYKSRGFMSLVEDRGLDIISVGGIDSAEEANIRLKMGASGVQVYTALYTRGPKLLSTMMK